MDELFMNYEALDWEDARGYPPDTKIKMLRNDGKNRTFVLKLPAGFSMQDHAHMVTEQHIILNGSYVSDNKAYGPGAYRLIPAHANHGPFTSTHGAIVLVIHTE
ncbi:MAG TPA: cupin domain-containing protein [bacterium]|nr:cupin domain-containing protein [bacterium]